MTTGNAAGNESEPLTSLGFDSLVQAAIHATGEQGIADPNYHNLRLDGAVWLAQLVLDQGVYEAVELGTSNGYSALYLSGALSRTGGRLTTYEKKYPARAELAREAIRAANLSETATVVMGDGVAALMKREEPIDLLFMDIWPADYIPAFENARHLLRPRSMIVVDNLNGHRDRSGVMQDADDSGASEYLEFIRRQPDCVSDQAVRGIGSGMLLTQIVEAS